MCEVQSFGEIPSVPFQDPSKSMIDAGASSPIPGRWRKELSKDLDTMTSQGTTFTEKIRRFETQAPGVVSSKSVFSQGSLTIAEFFGTSSTGDSRLSACLAKTSIRKDGSTEEYQTYHTPESDEYVMVINGELFLDRAGVKGSVKQGQGILLKAGERVGWSWSRLSQYVIICLPPSANEVRIADIEGDIETRRFDVLVPEGCQAGDWLHISLPAAGIRPEMADACTEAKPVVADCAAQVAPLRLMSQGIQARPSTVEFAVQFGPEIMARETQAQPLIVDNCTQIDSPTQAEFGSQVSPPLKDPGIDIGLQASIRLSDTDVCSQASPQVSFAEIQATTESEETGIQVASEGNSTCIQTVATSNPNVAQAGTVPVVQTIQNAEQNAPAENIKLITAGFSPPPPDASAEIVQSPEPEKMPSKSKKKKKKGSETQAADTTEAFKSEVQVVPKEIVVQPPLADKEVEGGAEPQTITSKSKKKKKKGTQAPGSDTINMLKSGTAQSAADIQVTLAAAFGADLASKIFTGLKA